MERRRIGVQLGILTWLLASEAKAFHNGWLLFPQVRRGSFLRQRSTGDAWKVLQQRHLETAAMDSQSRKLL